MLNEVKCSAKSKYMTSKKKISIVGFGAFTKLMIKHLQGDFEIVVLSRDASSKDPDGLKFTFADAPWVLAADVIILSIPAQFIETFLSEHRDQINPDALMIDVASVKQKPIAAMQKHLHETNQILGTHPIFGPGSAVDGLSGLEIVLCPVRIGDEYLHAITHYLEGKGLVVLKKTAAEHDREIAYVLGLTQYLGRTMKMMDIPDGELTTPAYEHLKKMRDIQGADSWDLFVSIMKENPDALKVNQRMKDVMREIDKRLGIED